MILFFQNAFFCYHYSNQIKLIEDWIDSKKETENFDKFNCIFDAAAMGQYLGGINPKNVTHNTVGFINETCVIKYNQFKFIWITINGIKRPFLKTGDSIIQIFNLHIHHKDLHNFI